MTTPYPFTPWYVPGWTSQQPYPGLEDVIIVGDDQLPEDILKLTITGRYVRVSGWAAGGTVRFTLLSPVVDSLSPAIILPDEIIGVVRNGSLEGREPGSELQVPSGFTYKVREILPGGRKFETSIPPDFTGSVDINELLTPFEVI
jgi:hypothetical protein